MAGLQSAAQLVLSQLRGSAPQWTAALQHSATTRGFCSAAQSPGASAAESPEPAPSTSSGVPKVVVFGGRGFVGSHVCREALSVGLHVLAISPSGTPPVGREPWTSEVEWVRGNALEPKTYAHHLPGALGAVSCIGAFGTQEYMLKINGAANVAAIEAAKAAGVPRFAFISAHIPNVPGIEVLLQGYVRGKQAAEEALRANYPTSGVAIRPGVIYGNRVVSSSITLPLQFAFQPVELALSYIPNAKQLSSLPLLGAAFVPPVSVEVVARAAVNAATGGDYTGGVLDVWDLAKFKQ